MADNVPLTDLCSICHNAEWKYRCPRCSAVTCSLACVTKHKARASCNGKRDPAAYIKKEALMTTSGIDRDYNFLTGVERAFDKAEQDTLARGISISDERNNRRLYPRTGRKLDHALVESRVDIRRAPKGMSRQKENHTDLYGTTGVLNWTVEWFLPDSTRIVGNCAEDLTVGNAYMNAHDRFYLDRRAKKRKRYAQKESRTTKHETRPDRGGSTDTCSIKEPQAATGAEDGDTVPLDTVKDDVAAEGINNKTTNPQPDHGSHVQASSRTPTEKQSHDLPKSTPSPSSKQCAAPVAQGSAFGPQLHYYLHRPLCSGNERVLGPISPDSQLADVLMNRTVVEFPTFYVLRESPDCLPEGLIPEAQWRANMSGIRVIAEAVANADEGSNAEAPDLLETSSTKSDTAHMLCGTDGILEK